MMYSPKIKEEHVRQLYRLKQIVKRPITHLANEAIEEYLNKIQSLKQEEKEAITNERGS